MPVIINEFEVLVEPPKNQEQATAETSTQMKTLKPKDMEQLVRHFQKRRSRLHAD